MSRAALVTYSAEALLDDMSAMPNGGSALSRQIKEARQHYKLPATRHANDVAEEFATLAEEWIEATRFTSSITEMAMHPAYQRIIGLGKPAVPFLLRKLQASPGHWFWALRAITGCDPIVPEDRGRVPRMTEAWLTWGRAQRLI
jgi:hypothetical protein